VKTFREIFDTLPKSVLGKDMGFSNSRITDLISNVNRFRLDEIFKIAALIEVDEKVLIDLIYNQYAIDKKSKKRRS
jgi:hypothetical protein